jgi:nuclear pore complex protein Nup188
LAKVASDCLVANRRSQGSEEIFRRLNQTRADLTLVLVQRLVEVKSTVPDLHKLLGTVWETIRQSNLTFEVVLGTADAPYYRLLLKLLFLALRVHGEYEEQTQSSGSNLRASTRLTEKADVVPTVLDIFHRVVANGLRDLAAFIHEKPTESFPADIGLITAILQTGLRIPGIELCYSQIVSTFVQADSARVATTLFTWSDSLAIEGDPIYGELSILYLLELSVVPTMAEQLAIDGVLGHIGAANITSYLRRSNVSPFAEGAGFQRCYSIWVRGILPLLLHMLDAVGASIASEVSAFLIQFPNLLEQASQAFDAPELSRTASRMQTKYITLSICSEIHTLSLIMFILNGFREEATGLDIPEVKWDAASVLENVEFWLGSMTVLRERILPMGEREVWMSKKRTGGAAANKLEEKVVAELRGIRDVLGAGEA